MFVGMIVRVDRNRGARSNWILYIECILLWADILVVALILDLIHRLYLLGSIPFAV